ncbi:MAG: hypothetical protein AABY40_01645 [Nanoarchaeota archaeon]
MLNEISIRCTYGTDVTIPLIGKFQDKETKKQIILLSNYKVLVDIDPLPSQQIFKYEFTRRKPLFNFRWASDDNDKTVWVNWIKQHPQINHPENKNKNGQTYFELVDKSKQDENIFQKDNSKVVAYQLVKDMNTSTLMEVAFFMMLNPSKMSPVQVFNKLCNLDSGLIQQNPVKFLAEWKFPDVSKKVTVRKAILLNLIESKDGIFYINHSPIGNTENLMVYMNENEKYFEYLKKEVAKQDVLPYGIITDMPVEKAIAVEKKPYKEQHETLSSQVKEERLMERETNQHEIKSRAHQQQLRLRELNVKGWHLSLAWAEEIRLEKIASAERALKKNNEPVSV